MSTFGKPELVKLGHCKLIEEVMIGEDQVCKISSMVRVSHWSSEGYRLYTYVIFALPSQSM